MEPTKRCVACDAGFYGPPDCNLCQVCEGRQQDKLEIAALTIDRDFWKAEAGRAAVSAEQLRAAGEREIYCTKEK